jgi:hypothetical protein
MGKRKCYGSLVNRVRQALLQMENDMDIEAIFIEQECEGGCQLATIRAENALLRAALLSMRNHCDVGKPELRELALARADAVLKDYEPSLGGMAYFRARYPVLETQPLTATPA